MGPAELRAVAQEILRVPGGQRIASVRFHAGDVKHTALSAAGVDYARADPVYDEVYLHSPVLSTSILRCEASAEMPNAGLNPFIVTE